MREIKILVPILLMALCSYSQEKVKFKIINMVIYTDGALLTGISSITNDTVKIISAQNKKVCPEKCEKIKTGNSYFFSIAKLPESQAYLNESFTIRIKTTVAWRPRDGIKNIPVIAKNSSGPYIKIDKPVE